MNRPEHVTVFHFTTFERGADVPGSYRFKAPRKLIEQVFNGTVVEGTGEDVPADVLDSQGRYRRVATGWGELSS